MDNKAAREKSVLSCMRLQCARDQFVGSIRFVECVRGLGVCGLCADLFLDVAHALEGGAHAFDLLLQDGDIVGGVW